MADYHRNFTRTRLYHLFRFEESHGAQVNRFVPHRHDFFELLWIREGCGVVHSDTRHFEVKPGTLFFVSPGQVHAWKFEEQLLGEIVGFKPGFFAVSSETPGLLAKMPFFYFGSQDPILHLDPVEAARIDRLFDEMKEVEAMEDPGRNDMVRAYLTIILSLARQCLSRRDRQDGLSRQAPDTLVPRFRCALEERFPQVIEVGDYADLLQVSRSHLNEDLRRHTGRSASELIHERRLLEAKRLLLHSALTISEIAYHLRFHEPSYFGRFFRRHTGQTPGEYRACTRREQLLR